MLTLIKLFFDSQNYIKSAVNFPTVLRLRASVTVMTRRFS
ncbi:unknown [[Mannheimia] succiniciproducens MBEL55E]|uniref:Uncharacterized protein n=1 Tax=Mannheimia succiniciproducens (strain KCTC 0769BP / MBEL55E) TaxID=221988 RepID=Q65Q51_MANSM|nr:unknown [[Mannheimia] succiniciproducens MBEL55E]